MDELNERFLETVKKAQDIYNDVICYDIDKVFLLYQLQRKTLKMDDGPEKQEAIKVYLALYNSLELIDNPPAKHYLWGDNMPKANSPVSDFKPYFFEMLLPEDVKPKGAIICVPGGDQGRSTMYEGYQAAVELRKLGYQCFILHNRLNLVDFDRKGERINPTECGVDVARMIRYLRRNARKYRINPDQITCAGFSNGGLTIDNCIQYFSGDQKVSDHFPGYVEDELDQYYGGPDAFICIYGPRFVNQPFDYSVAKYPPVFLAVGRNDFNAVENLDWYYKSLKENGVPVEIHTFAGVPHGRTLYFNISKEETYPVFDLWLVMADAFLKDLYKF